MNEVQQLAEKVLGRDPAIELIEYQRRWISIREMRRVAQAVNTLIDASGAKALAPIAFVPRNRPEALATILGLAATGRYIRMIHPYQSPEGIARDVQRLSPAVLVALDEDFTPAVVAALKARGVAGITLKDMNASTITECERTLGNCEYPTEPLFDLLTSGTTGPPKQFPITYDFIANEMLKSSENKT